MIRGIGCLLAGFQQLLGNAELRAMMWRMLLLLAGLMLLLGVGVYELSQYLAGRFVPTGDAWYVDMLAWLSWLFSVLLALAVGLVSYVVLGSVVSAPWLDTLAEKVEAGAVTGRQEPWWRLVLSSIGNAMMPLLTFIPYALLAMLLLLVPVYGTAVASVIWTYAGLKLLAFEFMDTPASRRGWRWPERKAEMDDKRWFYLGFAGLASALLLIPLLNLFVLPAAVVGLSRYMLAHDSVSDSCARKSHSGSEAAEIH